MYKKNIYFTENAKNGSTSTAHFIDNSISISLPVEYSPVNSMNATTQPYKTGMVNRFWIECQHLAIKVIYTFKRPKNILSS